MEPAELLDRLGYTGSPSFLAAGTGAFDSAVDYAHVFRHAAEPPCSLKGVYTLSADRRSFIPIVYVCQVDDEQASREVHRLVWNQDVVPFLIVNSPQSVRLYTGFRYDPRLPEGSKDFLKTVTTATRSAEVADVLGSLNADAIDGAGIWRRWGTEVTPEHRVDWHLLGRLKKLDAWLQGTGGLGMPAAHSLIGKYVYLRYLKDRGILSQQKLDRWGVPEEAIFGRNATTDGLREVCAHLDAWLNGEVFPIDFDSPGGLEDTHVRRVAGTFAGDAPLDDGTWQLHLDFIAYDFSYIPIEMLSVVYEQFLHSPGSGELPPRGRAAGAYYTPMPVVNFMLSELDERRPLRRGMRVFDPACGSGAFLVQCYRRLIEKELGPGENGPLRPEELRKLLKDHIFGVDRDPDACAVAELSLLLTLLDYVQPPDLEPKGAGRARPLPKLRDENIFCDNFFHERTAWQRCAGKRRFDWVVGNPPWRELKPNQLDEGEEPVWDWMVENQRSRPAGGNQMARAFAWRASEYLGDEGEAAFFLPAMTLFDDHAKGFRKRFLSSMKVHCVANFANLAEVLSAGRFRVPAAAFFWAVPPGDTPEPPDEPFIRVYSPLVANQEPIRPPRERDRTEAWSIVINASEVRDIPAEDVVTGSGLPWKLATWGSALDRRLLRTLEKRFPSFGKAEGNGAIIVSEGLQLRHGPEVREGEKEAGAGTDEQEDGDDRRKRTEKLEPVPEVIGKDKLEMGQLKGLRHFSTFPQRAFEQVTAEFAFAREGRAQLPLSVCRPPHVVVSEARTFAVYSDEFLVVPARQVGIASPTADRDLLKAMSLYLSSDFAFYHQFLTSSHFGVKRDVATLRSLRKMPFPLGGLSRPDLRRWTRLHAQLVRATCQRFRATDDGGAPLFDGVERPRKMAPLLAKLNALVYDALGINSKDRALVHDLVHVRLALNDGKIGQDAIRGPSGEELRLYAKALKSELDGFVEDALAKWHKVDIVHDALSGMVRVALIGDRRAASRPVVAPADAAVTGELAKARERLRKKRSQWVYFDRNLRVYEGDTTFVLKPMQRFHWTQTQARIDAREIIAETIGAGDPQ